MRRSEAEGVGRCCRSGRAYSLGDPSSTGIQARTACRERQRIFSRKCLLWSLGVATFRAQVSTLERSNNPPMPRKHSKTAKLFSDTARDYHTKPQASFRMSQQAIDLIDSLKTFYGIGRADVIEMAIRQLARKAGAEGFRSNE